MPPKALTDDEMYAAIIASDAAYNGRFVTGVLSTGIFCLPSCRARKPKRENVRFFRSFDEARQSGLRACRKCKPEEFERGEDRELETLTEAVDHLRGDPARIKGVPEMAERCGWGVTKLHEAVRRHWHTTPAELIARARIDKAKKLLLETSTPVTEIAFEVGFESVSGFNTRFRETTGMSPSAYRALPESKQFEIQLPSGYDVASLRHRLSRDTDDVIEGFDGDRYRRALHIGGEPNTLELKLDDNLRARVAEPIHAMSQAHEMATRLIGLDQDTASFEAHCLRLGHERLTAGRLGARIPQTPTVFDGMVWVIVGQQVNLTFARTLRRHLAESFGDTIGGMRTLPTAAVLASLTPEDLLPLQFSHRKAEYLIDLARLAGEDEFENLRQLSATAVEQRLMSMRGLGVWSTNYLMMRALGFADCAPLGDTGLAAGLKRHFQLDHTPKSGEQQSLIAQFSPYRSLATYHLWQSLKDPE